ncbi:MAG: MoxR family ATPase [Armatimonadetes bacterium]|nr:MoxR family ATPase [Armatimonadota bacterium]NOG93730.1 MoxR family ATPase [Armatimonadota bacterium]
MRVVDAVDSIRKEVAKAVVGQEQLVEHSLVAIFADGHLLLEGVPGVAKTLLVRTLARTLSLNFVRIQFTPDLMPSDVIGTNVFDQRTGDFSLRKGPVFTSVLLADEINRTPPKTQAALLEAMEERRVTIDGVPHDLPYPFVVFATQNPIEFEGTYPLPEAQLDRFLLKLVVPYPEEADEIMVLQRYSEGFRAQNLEPVGIQPVLDAETLATLRSEVAAVRVDHEILNYINTIVRKTRDSDLLQVGGSPRAGIAMLLTAKGLAAVRGRDFVTPDDVKDMSLPVLRHRLLLRPEAEIEGFTADQIVSGLFETIPVPR